MISSMDLSTSKNNGWHALENRKLLGWSPRWTRSCINPPRGDRNESQSQKIMLWSLRCEYLGLWVPWGGIWPLVNKVEAIANHQPPKTVWQVQIFVGIFNYYQDMWPWRAHILMTPTNLTSEKHQIQMDGSREKGFWEDELSHWKK